MPETWLVLDDTLESDWLVLADPVEEPEAVWLVLVAEDLAAIARYGSVFFAFASSLPIFASIEQPQYESSVSIPAFSTPNNLPDYDSEPSLPAYASTKGQPIYQATESDQ